MSAQRVVVVGAGMVGLSTAWFLQREGVEVTVVDKYDVAAGSSWGNAGWLSPALTLPLPEPAILSTGIRAALSPKSPVYVPLTANPRLLRFLTGFARHCTDRHWQQAMGVFNRANAVALDAYDELTGSTRSPVAAPTKPATPFLAAFASESDRAVLVEEFRRVNEAGGSVDHTLLDRDAVHALEPALGAGVDCGISLAGQRYINPGDFVHALADAVKHAGGEILTGREVADVVQHGSRAVVRFADTTEIEADAVVVATGTWLGGLARRHGVRTLVQAGRGYSFTVRPEQAPANPIYLPTQRVACTPLGGPGDGLRVAGMMEFRKPGAPLDPRRIAAIVDAAKPMFAGVDWSARTDEWVGSRPCTADGLPLVGRTRSDRVYVAGGHGMWGIALGPLTGRLLADQLVHGRTDDLLRSFDPLR
ncbi:NAD(P)/FAD-dependent oxidoreductase [Nocardioides terrisoli]|uniref:NAD(P)/FAD-dependent oxidoreductase n=1 Tax=Nocardioides terrisoli TaxID=3388267 RepID=UPI00287B5FAD|nr:FAD-dependent oxidoreductase [Nocardioides marmorisolisilvae]